MHRRRRFGVLAGLYVAVMTLVAGEVGWAEPAPQNLAATPSTATPVPGGAIIDNGVVQLGVNEAGELNLFDGVGDTIGVVYLPTGNEATSPGCLCEGWGAADALTGTTGWANQDEGGINGALSVVSFTSGVDGNGDGFARSTTDVGGVLEVVHDYHPSITPNLYEATVTIRNISGAAVQPRYRRVMDWDVEPTPFNEFVTIEGDAANLVFSSNNGFETANPLGGQSNIGFVGPPTGAPFADAGPADHGALFDFEFPILPAGREISFNIYYGAAGNENDALLAVDFVGATLYSLGQPNTPDGPTLGTPNTFIFAFSGLGGDRLSLLSVRKRAHFGLSDPGDTNGYDIVLTNPKDFEVTVNSVTDDLPAGFSYVPGSSTLDGVPIPDPAVTPDAGGDQLVWTGPIPIGPLSTRTKSFLVTVAADQPVGVYFNSATADAVDPDGDPVAVRSTGDAAPVEVPPPTIATGTTIDAGGSTTTDPSTGLPVISMTFGGRTDVTVAANVLCPDGTTPTAVTLFNGPNAYPMTNDGTGVWSATIPAASVVDGPLVIVATCPEGDIPNEVGEIVLYDPSGFITDAATGAPLEGATITLFVVPFAEPDTATETKDCRTVDTRPEATWELAPAADPSTGEEVDETLFPAIIDPTVNPQVTDSAGHYGWDVAAGCYFIEVSKAGYITRISPLVGVPPEVLDLDLKLTPLSVVLCHGLVPTIMGTAGPDIISGTSGPDVIAGLGGNDKIKGLDGDDTICGGDGGDTIDGGAGKDLVDGEKGKDKVKGGKGNDVVLGGEGRDSLDGGPGDDSLDGGPDSDSCNGGIGSSDVAISCETVTGVP